MPDPQSSGEKGADTIPETLPVLPLSDAILFPKMVLPLIVLEEISIQLIDDAMAGNRVVGLLASKQQGESQGYPRAEDLASMGASALILKMAKTRDNKAQLLVQGLKRFKTQSFVQGKPYLQAKVKHIEEAEEKDQEIEAMMNNLVGLFARIVELAPGLPQEMVQMAQSIKDAGTLADMIVSTINSSIEEKQRILETTNVRERLKDASRITNRQLEIIELGNKIQQQVKGDLDKRQREFYLREQLKAIKDELGEKYEETVDIDEFRSRIDSARLPEEARKEAERELKRLSKMHPSSAEYTVSTTYLDWLTTLPWNTSTADNLDIKKARKILDDDHYGLEKPKKRIIEYIAVRKLKPDSKGPILCFAGPPGTGKTSLGQSIAHALGRKFVRISLGGVRDEAEIRGHRRTYIGALPGRIIQGIRRAESNNPVFMLDEIDKVGSDFRGDPSAALLEVLDPQQNFSFSDHYLDVAFDLSKVMFITTANILDTVPPALRDRMEVLQLLGYTQEEKLKIANRFLIPRQRAEPDHLQPRGGSTYYRGLHARSRSPKPGTRDCQYLPRLGHPNRRRGYQKGDHQGRGCRRLPGARPVYSGIQGPGPDSGGCYRTGMDPCRRRASLYRGHGHEGPEPPDTDRTAGRRDEGIGPGGPYVYPHSYQRAGYR